MAKADRRYAKRKTRAIYRMMDRVMTDLLEMAELFQTQHEEMADQLIVMSNVQFMNQQVLEKWYAGVWGSAPSDWYSDA